MLWGLGMAGIDGVVWDLPCARGRLGVYMRATAFQRDERQLVLRAFRWRGAGFGRLPGRGVPCRVSFETEASSSQAVQLLLSVVLHWRDGHNARGRAVELQYSKQQL